MLIAVYEFAQCESRSPTCLALSLCLSLSLEDKALKKYLCFRLLEPCSNRRHGQGEFSGSAREISQERPETRVDGSLDGARADDQEPFDAFTCESCALKVGPEHAVAVSRPDCRSIFAARRADEDDVIDAGQDSHPALPSARDHRLALRAPYQGMPPTASRAVRTAGAQTLRTARRSQVLLHRQRVVRTRRRRGGSGYAYARFDGRQAIQLE
jgi:hypothetical protein